MNCNSLEIKLKKEMLKIDLILQFISALLSFEILSESRDKKNIAIQNVLNLVGTIRSLRIIRI